MRKVYILLAVFTMTALVFTCAKKPTEPPPGDTFGQGSPRPDCQCTATNGRTDMVLPQTVDTAHWGTPQKVGAPINTNCPEDAIEISRDGQTLYFLFTTDLGKNLSATELLQGKNGTYYALRTGGPAEFSYPAFSICVKALRKADSTEHSALRRQEILSIFTRSARRTPVTSNLLK